MSNRTAIARLAKINAALFLSKGKPVSFGVAETGEIADLLVTSGDPNQNISVQQNIRYLVQQGSIIERTSILE
jgi:imidazolonepropionase-like amidohydrolase